MRYIGRVSISILSLSMVLCVRNAMATDAYELTRKVAFLRDREIRVCDKNGHGIRQITRTAGKVEDFLFSPNLKYLAYSQIIEYVDEPGLWEEGETVPQRAVCSIVIIDLKSRRVLRELMPLEGSWIYIAKWLPGDKLLYYGASGFDVWGFFEYDLRKARAGEVDYAKGSQLSETTFSNDGSLMTYVDDSGLGEEYEEHLHIVDLKSSDDRILVSRKSIAEPAISNDKRSVAFMEVESLGGEYFDNLWVCDMKGGSLRKLYHGPAKPKIAGVSELAWSFDGRHLGMFFSPEALVLETQDPGNIQKIRGTDFNWLDKKRIVFARGNDVYVYDLTARESEVFLKDAAKPILLWKRRAQR